MMAINDAERWQQKKDLFQRAVAFEPAERVRFLESAADPELAREVEAMLVAHDVAPEFLEASPVARRPADPIVGRTVDQKYRVEEKLGRGGMGSVYRATHLWTGRTVAVKIIAPEFMRLPEFVERFKREAKAAGRLRHPNVVNVTDFGFADVVDQQIAYLVMEYLDGSTLGDWLARKGRMAVDLAVDVVEQISLAVDAAHAQGIIHRDLKPANIWLEPDGRGGFNVKVLDFGIAKLRELPGEPQPEPRAVSAVAGSTMPGTAETPDEATTFGAPSAPPLDEAATRRLPHPTPGELDPRTIPSHLTRAGMILGTPAYMSPEQCRGARLETASDIYSLGVITFEMLAGELPFSGDAHQLVVKHSEMPAPALVGRVPTISADIGNAVAGALAKVATERPPTATAFATALRAASEGDAAALERAAAIRTAHRGLFDTLAAVVFGPYIALTFVILWAMTYLNWTAAVPQSAAEVIRYVAPFALLSGLDYIGALNTAICARVIGRLLDPTAGEIKTWHILRELVPRLPAVLTAEALFVWRSGAGFRNDIRRYLFRSVALGLEGRTPDEALKRSEALGRHALTSALSIETRASVHSLMYGFLSLGAFAVAYAVSDAAAGTPYTLVAPLGFLVLFVAVVAIAAERSVLGIALTLLFLGARGAAGEATYDRERLRAIAVPRRARGRIRDTAKAGYALWMIIFLGALVFRGPALVLASMIGGRASVRALVAVGADPDTQFFVPSPLVTAAYYGRTETVTALLDAGADANASSDMWSVWMTGGAITSTTPLTAAAEGGHAGVVAVLLARGADPDARDGRGLTAREVAAKRGFTAVERVLGSGSGRDSK